MDSFSHQSPGMELNHRFRRIRTMCFRYTTRRSVGMVGLESTVPWSQATWGAAPLHPEFVSQNGRIRTGGTTARAVVLLAPDQARYQASPRSETKVTRVGFEPDLASLKGWQPHQKSNGPWAHGDPLRVRRGAWKWAGRRSNRSLLVFSQALHHLSYQPIEDLSSA
jgi:hypothetical protein